MLSYGFIQENVFENVVCEMPSTCLGLNVLRDVGTDISLTTQVCKLIVLCLKCKTLVCQPFDIALYVFSPVGIISCHEMYTRCCAKNSLLVVFECFHKVLSFLYAFASPGITKYHFRSMRKKDWGRGWTTCPLHDGPLSGLCFKSLGPSDAYMRR